MVTLENILHKDMTRKEFLATAGFGLASLFGASTILRMMFDNQSNAVTFSASSKGYGKNTYGGRRLNQ